MNLSTAWKVLNNNFSGNISDLKGWASAANGVSTAASALGMSATALAGTLAGVGVALVGIVAAKHAYENHLKEIADAAVSSAGELESERQSLEDYYNTVADLRSKLDAGDLTDQEIYDIKVQILDIQGQIVEKYGEQAAGIDLVNGKLDEQKGKLDEINAENARQWLRENEDAIEKATKELTEEKDWKIGSIDTTDVSDSLLSVLEKYEDRGIKITPDLGAGFSDVKFEGSAIQAKAVMADVLTDVENLREELGNADLWDDFYENAKLAYDKADSAISQWQETFDQAMINKIVADSDANAMMGIVQQAIQRVQEAVANSDWSKLSSETQGLFGLSDMLQASDLPDDIKAYIQGVIDDAIAGTSPYEANIELDAKIKQDPAMAQKVLDALDLFTDENGLNTSLMGLISLGEEDGVTDAQVAAISMLSSVAASCGTDLMGLIDYLRQVGWVSDGSAESVTNYTQRVEELQEANAKTAAGISAVQNLLSGQSTGQSISIDDFNSDALKDYTSALEYNNGSLQLNAERVRDIIEAKAEEQIAINDTNKALDQSEYLQNAAQIQEYRNQLLNMTDATDAERAAVQSEIDTLLARNGELVNSCAQYDIMSQSLREVTDAYHNWLNAQNASQAGDMFDDALNAFQMIDDVLNNEDSDLFGRVGRTDYQAALEFLIPDSVDTDDEAAINSYIDSVSSLLTFDDDGKMVGLDIEEFCERAVDAGLMVFDEASDSYEIAGAKTMEDFANGLGLSLPLVQAMFGEMEEFGGEFSWADEANRTLGDLAVSATEAAESLRSKLHELGYEDYEIQLDVSNLDSTEDKISTLEQTISEMQMVRANVPVDSTEAQEAADIIAYCLAQKQLLTAPVTMSVDTSAVSDNIANAINLINDYQTTLNQIEYQKTLGMDTTDAETKLSGLQSEIDGLDPSIKAALELDTTSLDTLATSIQNITGEMLTVNLGINEDAIIGYQNAEHNANGKVKWDNETGVVDAYAATMKWANGTVSWGNDTRYVKTHFTASGTVNWNQVNGTAHAAGTAAAGGNWGTATGGRTLVGELGREIVVDPFTGHWYTVGDHGAEFVNIPKGAIVFNHRQTEDLLEHGYAIGRASALAAGTAMVSGGIKKKYTSQSNFKSSSGSRSSGSSSSNSYNSSSSYNGNKTASSKASSSSDDFAEDLDWIEVLLDRIERRIKSLARIAESTFKSLTTRTSALGEEIATVADKIDYQHQAYDEYMHAAETISLDESYKALVREGKINLETITDKELNEKIKQYKDLYEKALDASDAVDELHESMAQLYQDNFDNVQEEYNNQLKLYEHLTNTYQNGIEQLEQKGYLISTEYYTALSNVEKQNISILNKQLDDMIDAMSEAMNSGEIEEYSAAWLISATPFGNKRNKQFI